MLSWWRAMWLFVFFDLPVKSKPQRKRATEFRRSLLKDGFEMAQYSVYLRPCPTDENASIHVRRVQGIIPQEGKVRILKITDAQFSRMHCFQGKIPIPPEHQPRQLDLY